MSFGDYFNPVSKPTVDWHYSHYEPEQNQFYNHGRKTNPFRIALAQQAAQGGLGLSNLQGAQAQSNIARQGATMQAQGARDNPALAAALASRAYGQTAQNQAMDTGQAAAQEARGARGSYTTLLSDTDRAEMARAMILHQQEAAALQLRAQREGWSQSAWQDKVGGFMGGLGAASSMLSSSGG